MAIPEIEVNAVVPSFPLDEDVKNMDFYSNSIDGDE
jgi:hypothetical protein